MAASPGEPEFQNNLGLALAAADREPEAIAAYRSALAIAPDHALAWNNLGLTLQAINDVHGALDAFRRAVALKPDFAHAHWNLALALLLDGQYAQGWREYDWRLVLSELGRGRHAYPGAGVGRTRSGRKDRAAVRGAGPRRCDSVRALRDARRRCRSEDQSSSARKR